MGVSKALHEILTINDRSNNIFVQQSPFLSVGSTTTYDLKINGASGTHRSELKFLYFNKRHV